MYETLIDKIYEAAAMPERWPGVLDELTIVGGGVVTLLFTARQGQVHYTYSEKGGLFEEYLAEGWHKRTDRPQRLLRAQHAGFLGDLDVYTREEMDREPVFTDFLRPRGVGWGVATAIDVPAQTTLILSVERSFESGPVDRQTIHQLDMLRPHLARAALVSAQLALEKSRAAAATLEILGLPAAIVGLSCKVLAANASLQSLIPSVIEDRRGRIALTDPGADALLVQALEQVRHASQSEATTRSIPVPTKGDGRPPHVVHVIPVRREARDVFTSASAIVIAMPVMMTEAISPAVLQMLFDLTPAEARVAREVVSGKTLDEIAVGFGVSRETVRCQLRMVFAKTGVTRQPELVALLSGKQLPVAR